MPAIGRLVRVACGTAGDVGRAGSVATGAEALAAWLAAGAAVPVPGAGGTDVAAPAGAAAPEAGVAAGRAVTAVPDAARVAAPAYEAAGLAAAGPAGVAVAAGCAWPPEAAVG
jgi:hypothetical protein